MLNYSFFAPRQIVFGWGRRAELGTLAAAIGRRAFIVSGSRTIESHGVIDQTVRDLHAAGLATEMLSVESREPEVRDVDRLTQQIRSLKPSADDVVIAIGGGSTIDLAKAASALVTNRIGQSVVDYLEGVGSGLKITEPPIPMIAVPTTAGTGAEATKNAVISSNTGPSDGSSHSQSKFKKSLRSDLMVPRAVVVDPELTMTLPAETTAATGMDAITQLIESYISRRSAPIAQALCVHGLKYAIPALPLAARNEDLREAREAMSHAALLSGIALANSGLGFAHGVAAALGTLCGVRHGLACAVMLPVALEVNRAVSRQRLAELEALFDPVGDPEISPEGRFIFRIERLCRELDIPARLRDIGVREDQLDALAEGSRGNSMSGNPRDLSDAELREILEKVW